MSVAGGSTENSQLRVESIINTSAADPLFSASLAHIAMPPRISRGQRQAIQALSRKGWSDYKIHKELDIPFKSVQRWAKRDAALPVRRRAVWRASSQCGGRASSERAGSVRHRVRVQQVE